MSVRHSIFVVGNAGTGKSQVSVLLIKAFFYIVLFSKIRSTYISHCSIDYLSKLFNKNPLLYSLTDLKNTL